MATTESPKVEKTSTPVGMAELLALIVELVRAGGLRALVVASRAYLGPAAYAAPRLVEDERKTGFAGLTGVEVALLGLAVSKLVWEAGELSLHNRDVDGAGALPSWQLDAETHRPPALSLAHMIAIKRVWGARASTASTGVRVITSAPRSSARAMQLAARSTYYATARTGIARTSEGARMATSTAPVSTPRRGGCGCGGAKPSQPRQPASIDPCARSVRPPPTPSTPSASCSCGCGGCASCAPAPRTRTYDATECPTWAISCETKTALRDCVKTALCDFARCVTDALCPDGKYDPNVFKNRQATQQLADCVGQLACSFLHCLPDALCPPDECAPPEVPADCLPCGYAVEVQR